MLIFIVLLPVFLSLLFPEGTLPLGISFSSTSFPKISVRPPLPEVSDKLGRF